MQRYLALKRHDNVETELKISLMKPTDITGVIRVNPNSEGITGFHNVMFGFYPLSLYSLVSKSLLLLSCSRLGRNFLYKIHPRMSWEILTSKIDNKIVGFAYLEGHDSKQVASFGLCVKEGYRGTGIGNTLMKNIIELAKVKNIKRILLTVYCDNNKAISLYEKFGFKPIIVNMGVDL